MRSKDSASLEWLVRLDFCVPTGIGSLLFSRGVLITRTYSETTYFLDGNLYDGFTWHLSPVPQKICPPCGPISSNDWLHMSLSHLHWLNTKHMPTKMRVPYCGWTNSCTLYLQDSLNRTGAFTLRHIRISIYIYYVRWGRRSQRLNRRLLALLEFTSESSNLWSRPHS